MKKNDCRQPEASGRRCGLNAEPLGATKSVIYLNTDRDIESARDFFPTDMDKTTYRSLDPRLIEPVRNIHMELDRPALQPRNVQPLQNIYTDCEASSRIKTGFYPGGYSSIYGGDSLYWIDPEYCQAYNEPDFVLQNAINPFVFQDPMGGLKPQYDRIPLYQNNNNVSAYTFDQDQMSFREDIMERQSRKINQSDYMLYVGHFKPSNSQSYW